MKQFKLLLAAGAMMIASGMQAQTDVTSMYLTNAGFDECTPATSDVAAKTTIDYSSNGWTTVSKGDFTTIAVTAYGDGKKVSSSTTPGTKKDGTTVSGNTLGVVAGWADNVKLQSGDITLPAGLYTLSVDHYINTTTANYTTSNTGFVTSSQSYLVSSTTFSAGTWITETVTFTLTEETTGKIQIGLIGNNKTGSATPAVFYDDVTLTYTDPEAAAHAAALEAAKYTLAGYIKKGTAINSVLNNETLAQSIETAQDIYDNADDYATDYEQTLSCSTTLSNAIEEALTGATPLELANANFNIVNIAVDGSNSATFIEPATAAKPYIYPVEGWTQKFTFSATAAQGNTAAYGATITGNQGNNGTNPPATDMFGSSEGGALHLSAGWGDIARYYKDVVLESGKYLLYYEAYNANTATTANGNYFGVSGEKGDFYGTTNSFVYDPNKTFPSGEWKASAIEFNVAKDNSIDVNVGISSTTGGSANGPKLWIDNVLVYRIGDVAVADTDAEAIIALYNEIIDSPMNADVQDALEAAYTDFSNDLSLDNYNALNEALIAAQESVSLYEQIDEALTNIEAWSAGSGTNVAECYRADYYEGNYGPTGEYDWAPEDFYTYYRGDQVMKLAQNNATDYTSAILNPGFETSDGIGWEYNNSDDTGVKLFEGSQYAFDGAQGDFIFNTWGGSDKLYIRQTIPGLPAGSYQLSAVLTGFNGADVILSANDFSTTLTVEGDQSTGYVTNLFFTLDEASDVEIMVSNQGNPSFFKCDDFKLIVSEEELADEEDYGNLNAAISSAESLPYGFDEYEYAPYKNLSLITSLNAAKAINQNNDNTKASVNAATEALTTAVTSAVANTEEVDAIFDGQFANTEALDESGKIVLPGWTKVDGIRLLVKDTSVDPGLNYTDGKAAVFSWAGTTLTYGAQAGYTLPLNQHELYELTFKVSGWRDGDLPTVVKVALDGTEQSAPNGSLASVAAINSTEGNPFVELKFYVVPTAEGNSTLTIYGNKHFTVADLSLRHASPIEIVETAAYDNTLAGDNVSIWLTRTIKAGMNTVVLPFDLTADDITTLGGEGAVAYTVSAYNAATDNLTFGVLSEVPANQPFFLKAAEARTSFVFTGKTLEAGDPILKVSEDCSLVGNYTAKKTVPQCDANGSYYILSGGKFYNVDSDVTIKNTRFYVATSAPAGANALSFSFEDEVTGINGVADETAAPKAIYNLQGQKVNAPVKGGIYIIDGKKMLVK